VDILAFQICGHGKCFKISEALTRKEARRNFDSVVDEEILWRREFGRMGYSDPEVASYIVLFVLISDFLHFHEEKISVLTERRGFIKSSGKVGIGYEIQFPKRIRFEIRAAEGVKAGAKKQSCQENKNKSQFVFMDGEEKPAAYKRRQQRENPAE
jgi:hypothetical protein